MEKEGRDESQRQLQHLTKIVFVLRPKEGVALLFPKPKLSKNNNLFHVPLLFGQVGKPFHPAFLPNDILPFQISIENNTSQLQPGQPGQLQRKLGEYCVSNPKR